MSILPIRGVRQSLEIRSKLDLLGVRDLVLDLVGDFQSALVQVSRRVANVVSFILSLASLHNSTLNIVGFPPPSVAICNRSLQDGAQGDLPTHIRTPEGEQPAIAQRMRDVRCGMVNLDPDSATSAPEGLKANRS